jgi:hypothetical protein
MLALRRRTAIGKVSDEMRCRMLSPHSCHNIIAHMIAFAFAAVAGGGFPHQSVDSHTGEW